MKVKYARTSDGIDIAYTVFGAGPDLLLAPGFVTHLDLMWDLPPFEAMLELERIFRLLAPCHPFGEAMLHLRTVVASVKVNRG